MMSAKKINLTTRSQKYDKPVEKKDESTSSMKVPSANSSPPPPSNGPLTFEKPNLDLILRPPKSTLRKSIFNPNAGASQFYNVVEDLAQAVCAMSTVEVLQSFPMQCKNMLMELEALDPDNTNMIHLNVENYKSRLPHTTRVFGRKVHQTV